MTDRTPIVVFGGSTSRSLRVVWLMEEMGLPYRIHAVNMLADEQDAVFLAVNPGYFLPAIQDGEVTMVESVAIMQYLMARYGPTPLAPAADDPAFPAYLQFLHMGEAGLATLLMAPLNSRYFAPEAERNDWSARRSLAWVENRRRLVRAQLDHAPYMAGEAFTAADISVTYGLELGRKTACVELGEAETAYLARTMGRPAFQRAMETSAAAVAS